MIGTTLDAAGERAAIFLSGSPLDLEAGDLGSNAEWAASAREYLSRAVAGAAGAGTVRVSSAALTVLLSYLDETGGARG